MLCYLNASSSQHTAVLGGGVACCTPSTLKAQQRTALQQMSCLPAQGHTGSVASSSSCDALTAVAPVSHSPQLVLVAPGTAPHVTKVLQKQQQQQQQQPWALSSKPGKHPVYQSSSGADHQQQKHQEHQQQQWQQRQAHHKQTQQAGSQNGRQSWQDGGVQQQPGSDASRLKGDSSSSSSSSRSGSSCTNSSSSSSSSSGLLSGSSPVRHDVPLQRFISSCIKQCHTWQQVDVVVREYGPAFNIIHVSAAITHLAQLKQRPNSGRPIAAAGQQQQQQQQRQQLFQQIRHDGHLMEQQVSGLHLITSQMAQQHRQLQQHLQQQQQREPAAYPHSSSSNGGSGVAHLQDGSQQQLLLVSRLLEQAVPLLPDAGSRQVANMLWALSVLQHPCRGGDSSSSSSSSTADAGAVMLLLQRGAELFGVAEAQHLSNMALAVAKLRLPAGQQWLQQLTAAWQALISLQHSSSSNTTTTSSSSSSRFQHMQVVSSRASQQGVCLSGPPHPAAEQAAGNGGAPSVVSSSSSSSSSSAAAAINPQATCNLLWALVELQQQPQQAWLQEVVAAAAPQLVAWPAKSVSMFMWGCARLGYKVHSTPQQEHGALWQQQQHQHQHHQHHQQQQQMVDDLQTHPPAAGALQAPPQQGQVAAGMLAALQQHAGAFSSRDLSLVFWAAAVLNLQVPQALLGSLLLPSSSSSSSNDSHPVQQQEQQQQQQREVRQTIMPGEHKQQPAVQQQAVLPSSSRISPSSEAAHSVSMLLWALSRLNSHNSRQLPAPVLLQPWLAALSSHAAAAQGQSLGVAAWALGRLGLTATQPQLVLRLLQAAAQKQQLAGAPCAAGTATAGSRGSSRSSSAPSADSAAGLPSEAVPALLWAAARCVVQGKDRHVAAMSAALDQQQQQQHTGRQQQPSTVLQVGSAATVRSTRSSTTAATVRVAAAWGSSSSAAVSDAAAAAAAAGVQQQQQQALKKAALALALGQAAAPAVHHPQADPPRQQQRQQQQSVWQLALVLWSCASMQLPLPAGWWLGRLQSLQLMLEQSPQLNVMRAGQVVQPDHQQQCVELAQALSVSVWALGRARVQLAAACVAPLQEASLLLLRQHQRVLSEEGCVLLLLGFTRLATTAAAQLPRRSHAQRCREQKLHRHLRRQLQVRANKHQNQHQQQHQQQRPQGPERGAGQSKCARAQRRRRWWHHHLQQQWARAVWRQRIWRHQRHGWVAASGLGAPWLHAYCAYTQPLLGDMGRDSLVCVLWALGRLRFHPGNAFMAAVQERMLTLLPGLQPRHIALSLWGFARLAHAPEAHLMQALNHAWEMKLAYATVTDTQQIGWSCRQLQRVEL